MKEILDDYIDSYEAGKQVSLKHTGESEALETSTGIPYDYGPHNGSSSPEDIRYILLNPNDVNDMMLIKPSSIIYMKKLKISFDHSAIIDVKSERFLDGT